jgi:hypothetical protein
MEESSTLDHCPVCNAVLFIQQPLSSGKCPFCVPNPESEQTMPVDDCFDARRTERKEA